MKKVKMILRFTAECVDEMEMNEEEFFKQQEHFDRINEHSESLREALLAISDDPKVIDYEVKMEVEEV